MALAAMTSRGAVAHPRTLSPHLMPVSHRCKRRKRTRQWWPGTWSVHASVKSRALGSGERSGKVHVKVHGTRGGWRGQDGQ